MDYRKKRNGFAMFSEHWRFLVMTLIVSVSALLPLPVFSHLRLLVTLRGVNISGTFSRDTNSVYWCVLTKPETNQIQFVLFLPVMTNFDWSDSTTWPADGNDYCLLQVKSNRHQWKLENVVDLKTGGQTVKFLDVTANTTSDLNLTNGRFWQLNDAGRATRLEAIDAATLARILSEVKANQSNFQTP